MKWYKRDPDAALTGFRGLTHDEKSAYGTIIDLSYSRDGNVPDDEHLLCVHIECRPQWWRRVKSGLIAKGKLRIVDGKLIANRVETALKEAANFSETQAKRATNGWVSKKKAKENNSGSIPHGNANTTTTTEREEEKPLKGFSSSPLDVERARATQARSLASALPTGALARSPGAAHSLNPDELADRRKRVQQELAEMTDEEVNEWCNGPNHGEKLRSANASLRHKNGLGG